MRCPYCGAETKNSVCEYCGSQIPISNTTKQRNSSIETFIDPNKPVCQRCGSGKIKYRRENQGEYRGKRGKVNNYRTIGMCENCGYTWDAGYSTAPKKRRTWLWIMGWICIFPLPLTILLIRKKQMNQILKYGLIIISWLLYILFVLSQPTTTPTSQTTAAYPIIGAQQQTTAKEVFQLNSAEIGQYGRYRTLNKGKVDADGYNYEYTYIEFYIPSGKYNVKSISKSCQITILKEGTAINSDGIEEYIPNYDKPAIVLVDDNTVTFELSEGEHIKLSDNSIIELEKIS